MGMYTRHFVRISNPEQNTPENRAKFMKAVTDHNEYDWENMFKEIPESNGVMTDEDINFGSGPKWYNYYSDIEKISEAMGDIEFYVYGDYEDQDIVWEKFYYNGYENYDNELCNKHRNESDEWSISSTEDIVDFVNKRIEELNKK